MKINKWCIYSTDTLISNNKTFRLTASKRSPGSINVYTNLKQHGMARIFDSDTRTPCTVKDLQDKI